MSTGRVIWLVWCLGWAAFWFFVGFVSLGAGWILMAVSLLAFAIPVGKERSRRLDEREHPRELTGRERWRG